MNLGYVSIRVLEKYVHIEHLAQKIEFNMHTRFTATEDMAGISHGSRNELVLLDHFFIGRKLR